MKEFIIDTNVPKVSVGHPRLSKTCSNACVDFLNKVMNNSYLLVIDDSYHILNEYMHNIDKSGAANHANRFLKWVLTNQRNTRRIKQIHINQDGNSKSFSEVPEELRDIGFDPSDHKFIAVAIANDYSAPIIQASDSKWIGWKPSLIACKIQVIFPCEDELTGIYKGKIC